MPIKSINQPDVLIVGEEIHLVKSAGNYEFAFPWYQDKTLVEMVDNQSEAYSMEKLNRMYSYLENVGELYFIEYKLNDCWIPVGDVTLDSNGDLPIIIAPEYQKKGIGRRVIQKLITRAKMLDFDQAEVRIYRFNRASQNLFSSLGFVRSDETETEFIYRLKL